MAKEKIFKVLKIIGKMFMYLIMAAIGAGILFALYIFGVFGLIGYIDSHQYDNSSKNLPTPLSTRGLPPPQTDVPVTLPRDPGEAGKATLAGIDSNNDGVRDDLEREIVYMYPQNQEVRRVLRAMVKKEQDVITTEGDHEHFKDLVMSAFAFQDCYNYLVFGDRLEGYTNLYSKKLWDMARNTSERQKKDEENSAKATPFISTINFNSESCTQDLVKGKY